MCESECVLGLCFVFVCLCVVCEWTACACPRQTVCYYLEPTYLLHIQFTKNYRILKYVQVRQLVKKISGRYGAAL